MIKFPIGKTIEALRAEAGFTVEEFVGTAMNSATLWRIENGYNVPTPENLEYICEKLGVSMNSFSDILLNKKHMEYQELKNSLDIALINKNIPDAQRIIEQLKDDKKFSGNKLNMQSLLAGEASLMSMSSMSMSSASPALVHEKLDLALKISHKNFDVGKLKNWPLSTTEFRVLLLKASQYERMEKLDSAIDLLYGLKENVESLCQHDLVEKGKRYPSIIVNLTNILSDIGLDRLDEIVSLCDDGANACLETGALRALPKILYNKAHILIESHNLEKGKPILLEAYYLCRAYKMDTELTLISNYALQNGICIN